MKNCTNCVFADWKRKADGKLHPSGDGQCTREVKMPELPQAFYWAFPVPRPCGGYINRKRDLSDHCVYFARSTYP